MRERYVTLGFECGIKGELESEREGERKCERGEGEKE
jgi:hypothetical protein